MGEDMEVNHNTTINDKADAVSLSRQHPLMFSVIFNSILVRLFPFSSYFILFHQLFVPLKSDCRQNKSFLHALADILTF